MTRAEVVALITAVADDFGLDRAEFLGGAVAESGLDPAAWRQGEWPDWSVGLFQQTIKYAPDGDWSARDDNVRFVRELFTNDPAHAARVAAKQYKGFRAKEATALDAWCRYNWPARDPATNPNRANYERGLREAGQLLSGMGQTMSGQITTTDDANFRPSPGLDNKPIQTLKKGSPVWPTGAGKVTADGHVWVPVALAPTGYIAEELLTGGDPPAPSAFFNADYPVSTQEWDWDCGQDSTWWALHALGRTPSNAWMEQMMLNAGIETREWGLMDASGVKLAAWITEQYQPEITARAIPDISFDQMSDLAGATAIVAGARNWAGPNAGHWVAVRRYRDGVLELANPGGQFSTHYGEQSLDRAAWDSKAPWSAVVIERKA